MAKKKNNQIRKVSIKKGFIKKADGSCLIEVGNTKVSCTATIEEGVPRFLRDTGKGWVTAEYGMLPASCGGRIPRDSSKGKVSGRTMEIQRLIGRSLRSVVNLEKLGERTVWIDADVIQGDGGTRTASITGCFVALLIALDKLKKKKVIKKSPVEDYVAAISVGIINGKPVLDLCYEEDSAAEVDMNVVMTGKGQFVEVQGTAEGAPFSEDELGEMLSLAKSGIKQLISYQKRLVKI